MSSMKNNAGEARGIRKPQISQYLEKFGVFLVLLAMILILSVTTTTFLTSRNLLNVVRQVSVNGIIAVGMMFVLLTGGIDLSVGSVVALSGVVAAHFAHPGEFPLIVPIAMGMLVGLVVGLINAFFVVRTKIVPFIATMGMLSIAKGMSLVLSSGRPISNLSDSFCFIGRGNVFGFFPLLSLIMICCFIVGGVIQRKTRLGRYIYSIGGNENAAHVSGIRVGRCKALAYVFSSLFAALAGIVLAGRITTGSPASGDGYELDAIAAVVIGGTSLNGGVGSIWGTLVGVLIVGVLNNGMDLLNVSSYYQQIMQGVIIILAVLLDTRTKRNA